jgi:hypothetical protein
MSIITVIDWDGIDYEQVNGFLIAVHKAYYFGLHIEESKKYSNANGFIYDLPCWQGDQAPPIGSRIKFSPLSAEKVYEIEVWKKYFFIDQIDRMQLYYDTEILKTLMDAQSLAVDLMLKDCAVVPYEYDTKEG